MDEFKKLASGHNIQLHNLSYICQENNTEHTDGFKQKYPPPRLLEQVKPTDIFEERKHCFSTSLHWGQRKLLMSEIEFLVDYAKKDDIVLYIGAAVGQHTVLLYQMFRHLNLEYHLYDPRDFDPRLKKLPGVFIHQQFFLEKDSKDYVGKKNVIFMSDIRQDISSANEGRFSEDENISFEERQELIQRSDILQDKMILEDMLLQQNAVKMIKPKVSMLKFRLPFTIHQGIEYLDGEVYFQIWEPKSLSTETRLIIPRNFKNKIYDPDDYNQRLTQFVKVVRNNYYPHGLRNVNTLGMDNCYDCATEIFILRNYFKWRNPKFDRKQVDGRVYNHIKNINFFLGRDANSLKIRSIRSIEDSIIKFQKNIPLIKEFYDIDILDENMEELLELMEENIEKYV